MILTHAQKISKAKKICSKYALGKFTIESACDAYGISSRTFYHWKATIAEVADIYKEAQNTAMPERMEVLKEISLGSFGRLLTGFTHEEEQSEYSVDAKGKARITKIRKTKKYFPPNVGAVIFALKVADPAMFNKIAGVGQGQLEEGPVKKQVFIIGGKEIEF